MKYKITRRLVLYFSVVLLLFSIVVSVLFLLFSAHHVAQLHELELKERAVSIASTLSEFPRFHERRRGRGGGYGAYLRLIDEIAMSEVWLVDEQAHTIHMGNMGNALSYEELPPGAEDLVERVFQGDVDVTAAFSALLGTPSVTVGAPVRGAGDQVQLALLLHRPVNGIDRSIRDSLLILVLCTFAALLLATLLSISLAKHFVGPLQKMSLAAHRLIAGDYAARTAVSQSDEIGVLAGNLDELAARLSDVEQERQTLDQSRRDFISNISHELRTPVTVLKGSLEVLAEGLVTEPQEMRQYFSQMLADIAHLQRLVNDLLELSRLQNADFQIEKSTLNLADVLMEAVRSMRRVSEQKQVNILLNNRAGAFSFAGDYGRLKQMLMTVLDNAVKFSPAGNSVEVEMACENEDCIICIRDHGAGISPAYMPHLFDRFSREHNEQNRSGTGLGLPIAKQIAQRHGVKIECESTPETGTCFRFHFPSLRNLGEMMQA